ncbi:MAG: YVTN family beta-propeller repeat protein, partial [Planctomycetota bacterium]
MKNQIRKHSTSFQILLITTILLPSLARGTDYSSPTSIVAGPDGGLLYVAESTANTIAVLDAHSCEVVEKISVADKPLGLAVAPDGRALYVTSATHKRTLQIIDIACGKVTESIVVGHTPVAVVAHPAGRTLYVCNQFDNNIGVVDLELRRQVAVIGVPREPVAAALTPDGKYLLVANHLPAGSANADYVAAVVSVIDTTANQVVKDIELPNGGTNLRGIAVSPGGKYAYVTHILSRYGFPTTYIEAGWVNTNAMTVIDVPNRKYVNTVLLDDPRRGAANPYGIACKPDGRSILVTHAGTHELSIIDSRLLHERLPVAGSPRDFVSTFHSADGKRLGDPSYSAKDVPNDLAFLTGIRLRIKLAGNGPRRLAIVGGKVYTPEYFTGTVGVVDIESLEPVAKSI